MKKCPECLKEFSDTSIKCPFDGRELQNLETKQPTESEKNPIKEGKSKK